MEESLTKIRHDRSKKDFPELKLDDDEYVEFAFSRARICMALIWGGVALGLIFVLLAFLVVLVNQSKIDDMGRRFLMIILFTILAASILVGMVTTRIFNGNKLYITNKHVTQFLTLSLMSSSVNIIDLTSVEDASFRQDTIWQRLFHYGTFRLSTVGDETTYTFKYSDISATELRAVTKLITEAKGKKKAD